MSERPWGRRATFAAVGVAALIGALGGGAVYAATDSGGHGGGFGPGFGPGDFGPPPGGGPFAGHGRSGHDSVDPATLHGEFVVPDGHGGFQTDIVQVGTVTAVSPTSITARSDDGFTGTYVIPPTASGSNDSTVPFGVNAKVSIRATRTGGTQTVTTIGAPQDGH
jgi:hypothetical protein